MKLALITPIAHLEETSNVSDFHMVLSHLLKNDKYLNFYEKLKNKNPNTFILCDNSANEGYMIKGQELISLAHAINADEIIAPDKYHDKYTTLQETNTFLNEYYQSHIKGHFSVMAVPQGKTIEEYYSCFEAFANDPHINTIGIGYRTLIPAIGDELFLLSKEQLEKEFKLKQPEILLNKLEDNCYNFTMSRIYFLKKYINFNMLKKNNKKIHLLGLYNPYELKIINKALTKNQLQYIRSCDSAAPWQAAQTNIIFNKDYGVTTKPKAFLDFNAVSDENQIKIMKANWGMLKEWAKHE